MLDAVKDFQATGEAIGIGRNAIPENVCAFQSVVPKTDDWRSFAVSYVWADGIDRSELEPSYSVNA